MEEHNKDPPKRIAQHKLAREVLRLVHGETLAKAAELDHRKIFSKPSAPNPQTNDDREQSKDDVKKAAIPRDDAPTHNLVLPRSLIYNQPMDRVLYHAGLVTSRSEGHRLVSKKGAYLGARPGGSGSLGDQVDFSPAAHWDGGETQKYIVGDDTLIIRVGKLKIRVIKIISDEEFEKKGLSAPGWKDARPEKPITNDIKRMKAWNNKNYVVKTRIHQTRR